MTCQKIRLPDGTVAIACGARGWKKRSTMPKLWPAASEEVKAAGYVSAGRGACRGCGVQMVWTTTPKGGKMPLTQNANGLWEPHFASCPQRGQFQKAKA